MLWIYYISFIHPSVDGHSGYFHLLAIVHSVVMKICAQIFVWTSFFNSFYILFKVDRSLQPAVDRRHLLFLLLLLVTAQGQTPGCPALEGSRSSESGPGTFIFYALSLAMALCAVLQIPSYPRTNKGDCQRQIAHLTKDMIQNCQDPMLSFAHIKFKFFRWYHYWNTLSYYNQSLWDSSHW